MREKAFPNNDNKESLTPFFTPFFAVLPALCNSFSTAQRIALGREIFLFSLRLLTSVS
jgi:hypothetical protein